MEFAIVDIETTGGNFRNGGITEVAIVIHDGQQIVHEYQSLINPQQNIPAYITGLTGIDDAMVRESPTFDEIAEEIYELLEGKVFVAHQVNFDFGFIREFLGRSGYELKNPKLCTVRLSRKIFPGMRSYSLGRICEQRNIPILARHRAMGDAKATAILFGQMLEENPEVIYSGLKKNSGESFLPPNFSSQRFREIPEKCGVYYMLDQKGKVIYVGKANNIRDRFRDHFTGQSHPSIKQELKAEVVDLKWKLTGSEFMALLLETLEIKRIWPKYNAALKSPRNIWGLFSYQDGRGFIRFQIAKVNKSLQPLETFFSSEEAKAFLTDAIQTYELCSKLCGIRKVNCEVVNDTICQGACAEKEDTLIYNQRAQVFIQKVKDSKGAIRLELEGRTEDERAVCVFEGGMLREYGFIKDESEKLEAVKPYPETSYVLRQFLHQFSAQQIQVIGSRRNNQEVLSFEF